jgi:hypothetical protein
MKIVARSTDVEKNEGVLYEYLNLKIETETDIGVENFVLNQLNMEDYGDYELIHSTPSHVQVSFRRKVKQNCPVIIKKGDRIITLL